VLVHVRQNVTLEGVQWPRENPDPAIVLFKLQLCNTLSQVYDLG